MRITIQTSDGSSTSYDACVDHDRMVHWLCNTSGNFMDRTPCETALNTLRNFWESNTLTARQRLDLEEGR